MVSLDRYHEVMTRCEEEGRTFDLVLSPLQLGILHGTLALAMRHPQVQAMNPDTLAMIGALRAWCMACMEEMGFTPEEVQALDVGLAPPEPKLWTPGGG